MMQSIIKIINKLLKREQQVASIPTPFDNLPEPFLEVEKFLEKEFYLLLYQLVNQQPTFSRETMYQPYFLSLILTLSIPTFSNDRLENEKKDILQLKEYFYQNFTLNCVEKMSFFLKVIFYRYYNINSFPTITVVRTQKFKEVLNRFKFLLKVKPSLYKKIERGLNKFIIDVQLEADKELTEYALNWAKMKLDFISAEITILRNQFISEDPRLFKLKTIPMDYWGKYDVYGFRGRHREELSEEISILSGKIESQYFISQLKILYNK